LTQIRLDFNSSNGDGLLYAQTTQATEPVQEGMDLVAVDAEGNSCAVEVVRVDGPIVYVRPDWDTWEDAPMTTVQTMVGGFHGYDAEVADVDGAAEPSSANGTNLLPRELVPA
jgi:hypothetical protein